MNTIIYQFKELLATFKQFVEQEYGIKTAEVESLSSHTPIYISDKPALNSPLNKKVDTLKKVEIVKENLPIQVKPIKQDIINQEPKKEEAQASFIQLEPLPKCSEDFFNDLKKSMHTLFPSFPIIDETLNDAKAHLIKDKWKSNQILTYAVIISFQESALEMEFLHAIATALTIYGTTATVISAVKYEKKGWDDLFNNPTIKFIIAKQQFVQNSKLKNYYKESAKNGFSFLKEIPLFQLADLSVYFKEQNLKALLWKSLQQRLKG
jgi:hypothetical protein